MQPIELLSIVSILMVIPSAGQNGRMEERSGLSRAVDLGSFRQEVEVIEAEIAIDNGFERSERLLAIGGSAAASGLFDTAAAAFAMFLSEFGMDDPNSENVAVHLGDSLFPFKYDEINVVHGSSGPRLDPVWRMGYTPRPEHLQQALDAMELAGSLAHDQYTKGSALLKLGWVHRVLGDWEASTAAWDRCAKDAAPAKPAADAVWLAVENLEWTNRPAEAAERLKRMIQASPNDARTTAIEEHIERLEAEVSRSPEWLVNPIASLQLEMQARSGVRSPQEVYRSVVRWLQRREERKALIAVSRWACDQDNWPVMDRVTCRFDLTGALLQGGDAESQQEAVRRFQEIIDFAPNDGMVVYATIQGCRILSELQRFDEAEQMAAAIAARVEDPIQAEPVVLADFAESLLKRGEKQRALRALDKLKTAYPDYGVSESLEALQIGNRKEDGR